MVYRTTSHTSSKHASSREDGRVGLLALQHVERRLVEDWHKRCVETE